MRSRRLLKVAFLLAGQAASVAMAEDLFPTQSGESGFLHIPVAESLGKNGAAFLLDLRFMRSTDMGRSVGPSPFAMLFGMGRAEAGFTLRQGGMPGDPRPSSTIPAGAGKFSIREAKGWWPGLAADLLLDRINRTPAVHLRAVVTTERRWRLRATAVGGAVLDTERSSGWTAGFALSLLGPRHIDLALEILRQPSGPLAGAGLLWRPYSQFAVGLGGSYLPRDAKTYLAGISICFLSPPLPQPPKATEEEKAPEEAAKPKAGKRTFKSDRPRFPLELRQRPAPGSEGGPAPHYPGSDSGGPAAAPKPEAAPIEPPAAVAPPSSDRIDAGGGSK